MNTVIERALEAGETLLWSGVPEDFETLDKTNGKRIRRSSIIKIVCTLLVILATILLENKQGKPVSFILIVVILAVGAYMVAAPWLNAKKLRQEVAYAITDRRLILAVNTAGSIRYDMVKEAAFRTDADGHTTLLIGKEALGKSAQNWRNFTPVTPYVNAETNTCECMVFYAVPDAAKVKQLLMPYISFQ